MKHRNKASALQVSGKDRSSSDVVQQNIGQGIVVGNNTVKSGSELSKSSVGRSKDGEFVVSAQGTGKSSLDDQVAKGGEVVKSAGNLSC